MVSTVSIDEVTYGCAVTGCWSSGGQRPGFVAGQRRGATIRDLMLKFRTMRPPEPGSPRC